MSGEFKFEESRPISELARELGTAQVMNFSNLVGFIAATRPIIISNNFSHHLPKNMLSLDA